MTEALDKKFCAQLRHGIGIFKWSDRDVAQSELGLVLFDRLDKVRPGQSLFTRIVGKPRAMKGFVHRYRDGRYLLANLETNDFAFVLPESYPGPTLYSSDIELNFSKDL